MKQRTKRIVALGALLTTLLTVSGCSNSTKDTNDNVVGYIVEQDTDEKENEVYSYIIDNDSLVSTKQDLPKGLSVAKVVEREEYGTHLLNEMTAAFYDENLRIVLPDSYSTYSSRGWYSIFNFDIDIICEKLETRTSDKPYTVVYSSMTAKRYLFDGELMLVNGRRHFEEGDNISSIAIYYDDELVAFKQVGVGSDCENVQRALIGNADTALAIIEESKTVTLSELQEIEESLNTKDKPKEYKLQ